MSHTADKDIIDTVDLRSWNDNLDRFGIVGIGNGMIQEANASHNSTRGTNLILFEIRWITNDHGSLCHLVSSLDTTSLAVITKDNLINVLIEHKGTSMNGTNTRETFWKSSQAINGVNVRRSSISTQGIHVDLQFFDSGSRGQVHVLFVRLQTHGVTNKLMGIGLQAKFRVQFTHGHFGKIAVFVSGRIIGFVLINVDQKVAKASLFKESHKTRAKSFFRSSRNLQDLASLVDIGSRD
mmetsp:Transcript_141/g.207  ORF Transcript_141/g.207 Transcript_141/m.207 type:complete len:238 (-) Transcript_141:399-1112(-)